MADEVRAREATQELEVARVITEEKEKDVQQAIWRKLEAQEEAMWLRVELEVA